MNAERFCRSLAGTDMRVGAFRFALSGLPAAGLTCGLMAVMNSVVETEFVPRSTDRNAATVSTYILEPMIICGGFMGGGSKMFQLPVNQSYTELKKPWQKVVSDPFWENPHDDQKAYRVSKPAFLGLDRITDINAMSFRGGVCHHSVRYFPVEFPPSFLNGNHSGSCKVSFAFDNAGNTQDINIVTCTDDILSLPTRQAVAKWYRSKGNCSAASNLDERETRTLRFDLKDQSGTLLPLPHGG